MDALRRLAIAGLGCLALTGPASAQQSPALVDEVQPPPPLVSGEELEPDITIVRTEGEIRHEYRMGGRLRGIRVFPAVGPSYLLVDTDGDGKLERSTHPYSPDFWINSWVLFSW